MMLRWFSVSWLCLACAFPPGGWAEAARRDYDPACQRDMFVEYPMPLEIGHLRPEEKRVLNKLFEAARLMSEIYLRQLNPRNPQLRAQLAASSLADRETRLDLFDLYFGTWDMLADNHPFYGDTPRPPGAGFYPEDLGRAEFDAWLAAHPEDRPAFTSLYTVIRRDGDRLVAVPYSREYRPWLEQAAVLLREAAALTCNPSLQRYLNLRAAAFLDNDYFASDLAWLDIRDTPIDPVFGPYEVYDDELFGYKASFQAVIAVHDPRDTAQVRHFKNYLREMEEHLPIAERYKNFRRPFTSPIVLANQIQTGGFMQRGIQAMAFNLPNDERVREVKGSKNVLLKNVMQAKFRLILKDIAAHVLGGEQLANVDETYFVRHILFHEMAHGLGPGTLVENGAETSVSARLKELHWTLEEAKADTMGAYNVLFMMEKGEFPEADADKLLSTYFVNLFRMLRFGAQDAVGRSAALQYHFLESQRAFRYDPRPRRFVLDYPALRAGLQALLGQILTIQGNGDHAAAKHLLDAYAVEDARLREVLASLAKVPVDIRPRYPRRL